MNPGFTDHKHSTESKLKMSKAHKGKVVSKETKEKMSKNNGMRGRSFHSVWVEKYGKEIADKKLVEFKKKMSKVTSGKNNPMSGRKRPDNKGSKSNYQYWIDKYGEEKANELLENFKNRVSLKMSGKNNPMYGKPAPKGSGAGIAGWYKHIYFRSLKELIYMLYLDESGIEYKSAEDISVEYNYNKSRTYRADFLVDNKYLIEIKPKSLQNTNEVLLKKDAAEKYCKENNLIYKILDVDHDLKYFKKIEELLSLNKIKFNNKNKERFFKFYKKIKENV